MTGIMEYVVYCFKGSARTPRYKFFPVFILTIAIIIALSLLLYKYSSSYFDSYLSYMYEYWPNGFYENELQEVNSKLAEVNPTLYETKKKFNFLALSYMYFLVINFFPMLNLLKRRLHDTGRSAWWILTPMWLIFIFSKSDFWDNQWGLAIESEKDNE